MKLGIKKTIALFGILFFILLLSCEKEGDCDKNTGYLKLHNSTDKSFNVYVDSVWYARLNDFESSDYYELPSKNYAVMFIQIKDSLPFIYRKFVDVDDCSYTTCNVHY